MKVFLVLLYLWNRDLRFEKKALGTDTDSCAALGKEVALEIAKDPRFGGFYFAGCVEIPAQEANGR